jgi:hypothetical protein
MCGSYDKYLKLFYTIRGEWEGRGTVLEKRMPSEVLA